MRKNKSISSAGEILRRRFYDKNPERAAGRDRTAREMALGMKIRRLREEAGWTQQELADRIGTQPSAISRIEHADYDGHSIALLERVAEALNMMLVIDFRRKPPGRPHGNVRFRSGRSTAT